MGGKDVHYSAQNAAPFVDPLYDKIYFVQDPHGHQHQQQQQLGHQHHSSRQLQQQQDHHGAGGISGPVRPPIMHHVGKPPELYNNHNLQANN